MERIKTKSFELAVYKRGNENAEKLALVIPGRLDTKDYAHMQSHVDYLASQGFFALSFDPPGTWESLGEIEIYTTTNYLKAIGELIEYFGNKPTLLLGHSRGGAVAMLAGTTNPYVSGIVAIMASYSAPTPPSQEAVRKGVQIEYRDLPPGASKTKEQKEFALPLRYFKDGEQYSPGDALLSCKKPKLLICGTQDEFTEPEKVREIYEAIPEPKTLREIDCVHDYRYHAEAVEEVNRAVGAFLLQNNV